MAGTDPVSAQVPRDQDALHEHHGGQHGAGHAEGECQGATQYGLADAEVEDRRAGRGQLDGGLDHEHHRDQSAVSPTVGRA